MWNEMDSKSQQLEAALARKGWSIIERRTDGLDWWADEVWVVQSDWSPRGVCAFVTFLVDPQWEGPRPKGHGLYAVSVSPAPLSDRLNADAPRIALKRWASQLPGFVAAMETLRRV